jgi:hypothetical protein
MDANGVYLELASLSTESPNDKKAASIAGQRSPAELGHGTELQAKSPELTGHTGESKILIEGITICVKSTSWKIESSSFQICGI